MPIPVPARPDVRAALKAALAQLRAAFVPSHTLAAELLLMRILEHDRAWLYSHPEAQLSPDQFSQFTQLVARRCAGEPTQYLTGRQEFWGREFEVGPGVLIPRPETEHVVEVALEMLGPPAAGEQFFVADIGAGSGCLAITLAIALPHSRVFATDISEAALVFARRNAAKHGVAERIEFRLADVLMETAAGRPSPVTTHQSVHLIVSNPPYISQADYANLPREIREHEPAGALLAGNDGNELYAPIIHQAGNLLAPSGVLVLELSYNQLPRVRSLLAAASFTDVRVTNDLAGIPRVIAARKAPDS